MDKPTTLPKTVWAAVLVGALLAACGAAWISIDLYLGFQNGIFNLVRNNSVTVANGLRYWLIAFGETLSVLTLLGITITFVILLKRRIPRQ